MERAVRPSVSEKLIEDAKSRTGTLQLSKRVRPRTRSLKEPLERAQPQRERLMRARVRLAKAGRHRPVRSEHDL